MTSEHHASSAEESDGWYKSSYSNASGTCVEVKLAPDVVLIRDSKDPHSSDRPILSLARDDWRSFVSTVGTLVSLGDDAAAARCGRAARAEFVIESDPVREPADTIPVSGPPADAGVPSWQETMGTR